MEDDKEDNKEPKKLNDDFVTFMKKRSDGEHPRYTERLQKYINLQSRRAAAVRRHTKPHKPREPGGKETDNANSEQQSNDEGQLAKRGRSQEYICGVCPKSGSHAASGQPVDRCGRRKRKRSCGRRKRKRSCGRKRRRMRSCRCKKRRRRSRGRRRKRSCSRRRRRKSCGRRRKRSRRRRRCGRCG